MFIWLQKVKTDIATKIIFACVCGTWEWPPGGSQLNHARTCTRHMHQASARASATASPRPPHAPTNPRHTAPPQQL